MAEHFEEFIICRAICDGQRGYCIIWPSGSTGFRFSLRDVLTDLLHGLGHASDREVIVIGEPEEGNAW